MDYREYIMMNKYNLEHTFKVCVKYDSNSFGFPVCGMKGTKEASKNTLDKVNSGSMEQL